LPVVTYSVADFLNETEIPTGYGGFGAIPENVTDVEIITVDGVRYLFANADGYTYVVTVSDSGALDFVTAYDNLYDSISGNLGDGTLMAFHYGGYAYLANANGFVDFFWIQGGSGELDNITLSLTDTSSTSYSSTLLGDHWVEPGGDQFFLFASGGTDRGFSLYMLDDATGVVSWQSNGSFNDQFLDRFFSQNVAFDFSIEDIIHVSIGPNDYVYTGVRYNSGVASFVINPDRSMTQVDLDLGDRSTLPVFTGASELAHAQVGGNNFVLNYSGNELYVYRINADGSLTLAQNYSWSGFDYFDNIATVQYQGHTFVLLPNSASVQDGGIALYEISANGSLTLVRQISTLTTNGGFHSDISDFEVFIDGSTLVVAGGDEGNDGLISFSVDLSDFGTVALTGTSGRDWIDGSAANDSIFGYAGRDVLDGGLGNDIIRGGSGADRMLGGAGRDNIDGGLGHDTLKGGSGSDVLNGNAGNDRIMGGIGRDTLNGGDGNDYLTGERGNDSMLGGTGLDILLGGGGNDVIRGGRGSDVIRGGLGFDTIEGGLGNDRLEGNANADTFLFADGHGDDTISDFDATNNAERIDLSGISAINGYTDLVNNHLTQVGSDVLINTGGGNTILLRNVDLADLDANDFLF